MNQRLAAMLLLVGTVMAQQVSLHPFAKAGKYGFMDETGTVRIAAQYDNATEFSEGLAPVAKVSGEEVYLGGKAGNSCMVQALKWGFIDPSGRLVIPFRYSETRNFSEGRAAVRIGSTWSFVDVNGKEIASQKFREAGDFHEGLSWVQFLDGNKSGYIDKSGNLVLPLSFGGTGHFEDGVLLVQKAYDEPYKLIDHTGRVITEKGWIKLLGGGFVAYGAASQGPLGLMNVAGKVITPPKFESISSFSEGLIAVMQNKRWGFIDGEGKIIIPISFSGEFYGYDYGFHEGLSMVYVGGHFGYVNQKGKVVIAPNFSDAGPFSGGLASACFTADVAPNDSYEGRKSRCGYINTTGAFVISPHFSYSRSFDAGWAEVTDPVFGRRMMINRLGKIVYRPRWEDGFHPNPRGECHFPPSPPAAPPPPDYSVTFTIASIPTGASVYLVPIWDWQNQENGATLMADSNALATYLVTEGATPLNDLRLKAQVYMAIFDLAGKRKVVKVVVARNGPSQITVNF